MAGFQKYWISNRMATLTKEGPRLTLFSTPPPQRAPAPGSVHIRIGASLQRGTGRAQPAAGWALTAHLVGTDGTETPLLSARGAAPSRSTHAGRAPETAPRHHTQQSAHQAAIAAALDLARQYAPRRPVVITVDSTTALRNLTDARPTRPTRAADAGGIAPTEAPPPAAQPSQATSPDRGPAQGAKRPLPRDDEHPEAPPQPKRGRPNRRADKRSREQRDPLPLRDDHARQTIANLALTQYF